MQAFEDPVSATGCRVCLHVGPSHLIWWICRELAVAISEIPQMPQSQDKTFVARTAIPVPAAMPPSAFLRLVLRGQTDSPDHDRNETGDLCDRSGNRVHGGEAGIEWRTALRVSERGEHG